MTTLKTSDRSPEQPLPIVVCALYKFATLENFELLKPPLQAKMEDLGIRGTLLLALEGINGTIAGTRPAIDDLLRYFSEDKLFAGRLQNIQWKESFDETIPFHRTKVKLKKEIVTMGVDAIDPTHIVGTYVKPEAWNDLISDPDVTVVDTRNAYEIQIGTFKNAINPHTTSFREFPEYAKQNLDPKVHKKVAMFCTGGIRCEKSTAYLKEQGYDEVYHLEGGILKYLEEIPQEESLWQGECFVFDNRVTVDHDLKPGQYDQCHACRMPITEQDKLSNAYQAGVSCPHCISDLSESQKKRFLERERQVQLAKQKGKVHIGGDAKIAQQENKLAKTEFRDSQRQRKN
jgi:UPF0176 protein